MSKDNNSNKPRAVAYALLDVEVVDKATGQKKVVQYKTPIYKSQTKVITK